MGWHPKLRDQSIHGWQPPYALTRASGDTLRE